MRCPSAGSAESGAAERIVISALPFLTGRMKLPVKVAPGWSRIVSPGCAALSAACKSPPAFTVSVAAVAEVAIVASAAHTTLVLKLFTKAPLGSKSRVPELGQRCGPKNAVSPDVTEAFGETYTAITDFAQIDRLIETAAFASHTGGKCGARRRLRDRAHCRYVSVGAITIFRFPR